MTDNIKNSDEYFVETLKKEIEILKAENRHIEQRISKSLTVDKKGSLLKLLALKKKLARKKQRSCKPYLEAARFVAPLFLLLWWFDYLILGVSGVTELGFVIKNITMFCLALYVAKPIIQDFCDISQERLLFKIHNLERNINTTQPDADKAAS